MTISSFILPVTVLGIGLGLVMSQLVNLTLSSVRSEDTSEASGVNNALGELGNSFGTAVIGSLLLSFFLNGLVFDVLRDSEIELSTEKRNELIIQLQDSNDLETETGQASILAELSPEIQEKLPQIFDDNSIFAMQETLMDVLLIILLTLLASTFLPQHFVTKSTSTAT